MWPGPDLRKPKRRWPRPLRERQNVFQSSLLAPPRSKPNCLLAGDLSGLSNANQTLIQFGYSPCGAKGKLSSETQPSWNLHRRKLL